jgi:hypothetical protein
VLKAAGVRVRFEPEIVGRTEGPRRASDLASQRRRWRAALGSGPQFLANALESKPLVLAQLLLTGSLAFLSATWGSLDLRLGWFVLLGITFLVYLRAACEVGVSWRWLRYSVEVPLIVARLALVTLGGIWAKNTEWQRTRRNAELNPAKG